MSFGDGNAAGSLETTPKAAKAARGCGIRLGAFQQKCSAFWVLEKYMNSLSYGPWRGFFDVYFIAISNCLTKMMDIFTSNNVITLILGVYATRIPGQISHLLFLRIAACDGWKPAKGAHKSGDLSDLSSNALKVHHEATITSHSIDSFLFHKPFDGLFRSLFNIVSHLPFLAHLKRETRHNFLVNIAIEGVGMVYVTWDCFIIVV